MRSNVVVLSLPPKYVDRVVASTPNKALCLEKALIIFAFNEEYLYTERKKRNDMNVKV